MQRPTFYKICKTKNTGQYSALPYVATLLNCMLWTFYGAGAVAGLIFVVSINVAGLILEGCYVTIHLLFGTHDSRVCSTVPFSEYKTSCNIHISPLVCTDHNPKSTRIVWLKIFTFTVTLCFVFIAIYLLQRRNSLCLLKLQKTTSTLLAAVSILYGVMVSVVLVVVKSNDSRAEVVGSVCVFIGVLMYAAPLAVMVNFLLHTLVISLKCLYQML